MSTGVRWVADRERAGRGRRGRLGELHGGAGSLVLGAAVLLIVGLVVRGGLLSERPTLAGPGAGAGALSPTELTAGAASTLSDALAPGGTGLEFEIVQTSTIVARPGGPLVELPDPADRTKSLGFAERYPLGTLIERGFATPDGYWMELLHGPEPGTEAAFELATAQVSRQALVRDGKLFRNDGEGWHETDELPGIGLDPATIALLPGLLTTATGATEALLDSVIDPATAIPGLRGPESPAVRALAATTTVADAPGIIAVDLVAATEITTPAVLAFDAAGRLVGLTITARNTNLEIHDLIVETVITFRYPDRPPSLPEPLPAYVAPAPAKDGQ